MPIVVRNVTTKPNQTATFDFSGHTVLAYTIGIAYWSFSFDNDHHVRTLALSLSPNKPDDAHVTVSVNGTFTDDSGSTLDAAASSVVVCCIAVVDYKDSNVVLASANGIPANGQSAGIALPSSTLSINAAFLSGWKLNHSSDNEVASLDLSAGVVANGTTANIVATASMHDNSGNQATAELDAGLLAATTTADGVCAAPLTNQQTTSTISVDLGQQLSAAVVLLQDYQVRFHKNQDNHVRTMGGGCKTWTVEGSTVRLTSPRAFISDDSGNVETNDSSSVSFVVIGIPKTVAAS
ncbi:hypothetical protein [Pyxidicoccus trucidator]|uniref:hypothetical protein n=1 Tax=Pyxidicoccus trucidator TaxID=2709662 RepID=UPI0013D9F00F|nr:hypothetical protein [Pyxidicoccus trucidator]